MKKSFISSVSLNSFAGRTRSHTFAAGVNLVIGANGAGKTTISNAINFVLSGKVPGLPKTNGGIMDNLGSGLKMTASLDIDGVSYDRSLKRSGSGVKGESKMPAPANLVPPVMLDLEPFLAASPKVRAGMILGACGDDVPLKLHALLAETGLEGHIGTVKASDDVQDWLAEVDEIAKATGSGYTRSIAEMRGTLAGLEILDTSATVFSGPPLSELRANVSRLEREIATLTGEANAIASRPTPIQPSSERPNGTAEAFEGQLADAQTALRAVQSDLARVMAGEKMWDRYINDKKTLENKLAEAQAAYQVVADGWEPVDEAKLKAEADELLIQSDRLQTKLNAAKNDALTGKGACPCCGAAAIHWNREAAEEADVAGWEEAIKQHAARLTALRLLLRQSTAVSMASDAVARATQALEACEAPVRDVEDPQDLQDRLNDLTEIADALAVEARRARAWDGYLLSHLQHSKGQERLVNINIELGHRQSELASAFAALAAAETDRAAQAKAEACAATRKQAESRLVELEADETEFKSARAAWQAGVTEIMDAALREVLKVCEVFTAGLFVSPLTVHDLDIGCYEHGVWVKFDVLRGSDKRMAIAAIQCALAIRHSGFRFVCIDEFGTVDPTRKPAFLANLVAACEAGLVDQVMVFDNRDIDGVPEAVNTIHLAF